ncbi:hypothetical protein ACMD2_12709, partial [Ananas comosus]
KSHVRRICDKVFNDCADNNRLDLNKLHVATLMVYNSINKQLLSPHKEPPPMSNVAAKIQAYRSKEINDLKSEQFYELIIEWMRNDLRLIFVNRAVLAFLAAPALAVMTKNAARRVPRVGSVVEKVPTPLLFSVYSVGLVLLQDARVG